MANDHLGLTKEEFYALPEYSHSYPTGQTPGKVWRCRRGSTWWRVVYGLPYPEGHEHHGSIPLGWRLIYRDWLPPAWPRSVQVPLRPLS